MNNRRVIVEYLNGLYYNMRFQKINSLGHWDLGESKMVHSNRLQVWIDNWIQLSKLSGEI